MPMESLLLADFDPKGATSNPKVATSDSKVTTSNPKVATSLKKKMSKQELYDYIINICSEWLSMEEIVEKTNRSALYIRIKVIPVMLKEKMLVMLYPGTPNHPNQKYKHVDI